MLREGEERRRYPRSRRGVPMIVDESGPGVLNHVDNISGNGVLCHTVKPVPLMTKLNMVLQIPSKTNPRRVDCEGVVVRCEPHEQGDDRFKVAILYTKMKEDDYMAIMDYVDEDLADFDPMD